LSAREKGFTLVETLAALTVAALLAGGVLAQTGQWFTSWKKAAKHLQATDRIGSLLVQIRDDMAGAVALPAREAAFRGSVSSVRFLLPGVAGLEEVVWTAMPGRLNRARRLERASEWRETDVADLASSGFEFLGEAGDWQRTWRDGGLPRAVRITLRASSESESYVIIAPLRMRLPAVCARATSLSTCEAMAAGQPIGMPQGQEPGRTKRRTPR
jgi:general secretion pathway protein J